MTQLELIIGSEVVPFPAEHFFIGSAEDCAIRLSGPDVRPRHAEVLRESDGTWWVRDTSGSGSVRVDGSVTWESQLTGGSFLTIGSIELAVRDQHATGSGTVKTKSGAMLAGLQPPAPEQPAARPPTRSLRQAEAPAGFDATTMRPRPPKRHLEPGDLVDSRYRIVRRIAAGGMGEVYEGEHIELHKPVAIKVMLPELSKDAEFVQRFKREAIASSRIGQQNIVDISDFGRTPEGRFYFVMELLDGRTLASYAREGPMPLRRATHIVTQIARALGAAHDRGIVHRDLKPENVMLLQRPGQPDFVKVLDFGIAKVNEGHGAGGLTQIGMVVGTPQYMSPEQAAGLPVDTRTDIYSLGLIFYEVLTGRPTFKGETPSVLMAMQMTAAPPPLAPGPVELPMPREIDALIFHMLQKKPGDRPESMHQVLERLEPFAQGPITASRTLAAPATGSQSALHPLPATPLPQRGGTRQEPSGATPLGSVSISLAPTPMPSAPPTSTLPPAAAPTGQGKKLALVFGGCLVLAIVMGIGAAAFINGQEPRSNNPILVVPPPPPQPDVKPKPDPEPTPDPKPAAQKLTLTFTTKPAGAEVFEDDVLVGTTPVKLSREAGQIVALRFELKGHKPLTRKVRFDDADREVSFELEKVGKPSGPKKPPGLHDDPYSNVKELKDLPD